MAAAVTVSILIGGCQTQPLKIAPFASGGAGAPYNLRFTTYDIAVKWRVTSCGSPTPARAGAMLAFPKPFSVVAEVTAEASHPNDPEKAWLIDLQSLDGFMNTSDVAVTYENGYFKSLNASVEDKTVETVTALATAGVKLATLGAVGASLAPDACADLVAAAETATTGVESRTLELAKARRALLEAQAAGLPQKKIRRQEAALMVSAQNLEDAVNVLAGAIKAVTYEEKFRWPPHGEEHTKILALKPEALKKWKADQSWPSATGIKLRFEVKVRSHGEDLVLIPAVADKDMSTKVSEGKVPFRQPKRGALVVSLKDELTDFTEIYRKEGPVIQSGDILYVQVQRKPLRSSTAGFALDAEGRLTSMNHKQSNAPGEALGKSVQAFAEQAATLRATALDRLKAENATLDEMKKNAELKKALAPPAEQSAADKELAAITSELTLKKAQLELMQTREALDKLNAS